jgi:hypothetical protein
MAQAVPNSSVDIAHNIARLPFVAATNRRTGKNRNFWSVSGNGDFQSDNQLGRLLATEALKFLRTTNFTPVLGWMVDGMIKKGGLDGVMVGFWNAIADELIKNQR